MCTREGFCRNPRGIFRTDFLVNFVCLFGAEGKDKWIFTRGVCVKIGDFILNLKVFFSGIPREQAILRKSKAPRKSPEKWTFLSLAFHNAPSLHTVTSRHFLQISVTFFHKTTQSVWRVPNPPGANPLLAERAPWRSSQSCVTEGGQQPIGNPYSFLSFLLHTRQPLIGTRGEGSFPLPGG